MSDRIGGMGKVTYNADVAMRQATGSDGSHTARRVSGMTLAEKQASLAAAMRSERIDMSGDSPIISEDVKLEDDHADPVSTEVMEPAGEENPPAEPVAESVPAQAEQPQETTNQTEADTSSEQDPSTDKKVSTDVASELAKLKKQVADQDLYNRRVASENGELKKKLTELEALPKNVEEMNEVEKKRYLDLIDDDKKFDQRLELKYKRMREAEKRQDLETQSRAIADRQQQLDQTRSQVDAAMPDLPVVLDGMVQAAIDGGATPQEAAQIRANPYLVAMQMHPQAFRMLYIAGRANMKAAHRTNGVPQQAGAGRVTLGSLGKTVGKSGTSTRLNGTYTAQNLSAMSHADKMAILAKRMRDEGVT